jgi:8-oxo-dGTP diphosphatase
MENPMTFGIKEEGIEYIERPGAYGIAIRDNSILIETAQLGYFLPGGGIEKDETIEQTLRREFLEETGYELTSYKSIGSAIEYMEIPDKHFHMKKVGHFYLVELGAKHEPTYDDGHVYPVSWISLQEVTEKMYLASQSWAIKEALKILGV